jgi:histidinol-phosphate aminotransferase
VEAIEKLFARPGAEGRVKILFLTSPNNPTGNLLGDEELRRLLALPALVVLDEAYIEFAEAPSRAEWVLRHDNLIVLRTFSKAAGIAGLRLGYGICPAWLMAQLWKFKQPYNVNVAAAVAGLASLRHVEQITEVVEKLKNERMRLVAGLQEIPYLRPFPTQANFVLCDVIGRECKTVKLALERKGILVRHYSKPRLENCIRISVGRPEQTERLLAALRELA